METNIYLLPVWETVTTAWGKVKGSKASFWAAIGIYALLLIATVLLFILFPKDESPIAFHTVDIISRFLAFLLGLGIIYIGILRAFDRPFNFRNVFRAFDFKIMIRTIAAYILQILVVIPPMIVTLVGVTMGSAAHTMGSPTMLIVMWILSVVVSVIGACACIYIGVRISYTLAFILDKEIGPWQAIKSSFKATQANFWPIVQIGLVQLGIMILCGFTLGIGFIWAIPFFFICHGTIYKRLSVNVPAQ